MLRYEFEKLEDFRRAVKEAKLKKIFYRVEYTPVAQNSFNADFRVTAIGEKEHFTFLERIASVTLTQEGQAAQRAEFEGAVTNHKNKFFDNARETMPEILTIAGIVYP
jgi:hypothetical protein